MSQILIVDDDKDLLDMVSLVLRTNDLKVNCIDNGTDFMPAVEENAPDLVLMDIYLGDADGRKLCYSLKTSEKFGHIPVILYSAGNITTSSVKESMADVFLSKPFDNLQLINKIKSLIN